MPCAHSSPRMASSFVSLVHTPHNRMVELNAFYALSMTVYALSSSMPTFHQRSGRTLSPPRRTFLTDVHVGHGATPPLTSSSTASQPTTITYGSLAASAIPVSLLLLLTNWHHDPLPACSWDTPRTRKDISAIILTHTGSLCPVMSILMSSSSRSKTLHRHHHRQPRLHLSSTLFRHRHHAVHNMACAVATPRPRSSCLRRQATTSLLPHQRRARHRFNSWL